MESEPNIENLKSKISIGIKFWLIFEDKNILGSGWANLLECIEKNNDTKINEAGSLTQAAKDCGYSYKYAWNILKRIHSRTGASPVITGKGGRGGGGWIKLSKWGQHILNVYREYKTEIKRIKNNLKETFK